MINGELKLTKAPPKKIFKPIQLRTNTLYKTVDGRKAEVWYINKGSVDHPVIGAVDNEGVWECREWNEEGRTKRPYGANNNIIGLWSEK